MVRRYEMWFENVSSRIRRIRHSHKIQETQEVSNIMTKDTSYQAGFYEQDDPLGNLSTELLATREIEDQEVLELREQLASMQALLNKSVYSTYDTYKIARNQ
ncbi:hypothetical protein RIR_jg41684.t1 [Rhizophagus irregularis DAOM 181602=DAOM 197198]|uniref:Uncharacterized protein n=1 Tax=Rhizophagus irregularis (strain DAOM 181602 / DAOM 197198 / MUCL 43194) TaxID=747089 RepID=U9T5J0_RHIID|nr:hypothetical protein RIR_jg41684.t1 [Rhizophagus irregularis DAOM 181602=DAOM 197198]